MDFKTMGDNLGLEEDEFIELVELFVDTASADIGKLEAAYKTKDLAQAADAAHSLKGSSGNLGFLDFSEVAKKAEENSRNNDDSDAENILAKLKQQIDAIKAQLEQT